MDALIALLAVALLMLAFRKVGWWRWFWLGLALYLGGFELAAKLVTGQTLSQQFWAYAALHPVQGWLLGGLVVVGGIGLALHLMWKQVKNILDFKSKS